MLGCDPFNTGSKVWQRETTSLTTGRWWSRRWLGAGVHSGEEEVVRSLLCFSFLATASRRGSLKWLPARLRRTAPGVSVATRCSAPPPSFPHSPPPLSPFLLLAAADQERGKPQTGLACERGLGPGGLCAWSSGARKNTRRRALVVRRGEVVDVVTQLWAATSL
jgi:hypothetical protein